MIVIGPWTTDPFDRLSHGTETESGGYLPYFAYSK